MGLLILTVMTSLLSGCNYSRTSNSPPSGETGLGQTPEAGPTFKFADVQAQVFSVSCKNCHIARGLDLTFEDYETTRNDADEILNRVIVAKNMPPGKPLTAIQEQVLRVWLDEGAPQ